MYRKKENMNERILIGNMTSLFFKELYNIQKEKLEIWKILFFITIEAHNALLCLCGIQIFTSYILIISRSVRFHLLTCDLPILRLLEYWSNMINYLINAEKTVKNRSNWMVSVIMNQITIKDVTYYQSNLNGLNVRNNQFLRWLIIHLINQKNHWMEPDIEVRICD